MARHTTPMYRAPEMLDMWANYQIDTSADVWALGCTLYFLCFNQVRETTIVFGHFSCFAKIIQYDLSRFRSERQNCKHKTTKTRSVHGKFNCITVKYNGTQHGIYVTDKSQKGIRLR